MTTYICKCGRIERKSTNADTTGNRDTADCKGCPYLLPYGNQKYIQGEGYQLEVKGYECRMSQTLEYASRFVGSVSDKCVCAVVSLDFDFLWEISGWIQQNYPDGELSGSFSPDTIRAAEFSSNGRYRYSIYCAQNKAGMAAKAALLERFFHPDGSRKDMSAEEEKKRVLTWIEESKRITQIAQSAQAIVDNAPGHAQPAECLCASCTCTGCHEECFGSCQGCGQPVDHCNSYQTEGEKRRTSQEEATMVSPGATAESGPAPVAEAVKVSETAPGFDTADFDWETVSDLQLAEREYRSGLQLAQVGIRRMADGVAIAHEALATYATKCRIGKTGQFEKQTASFGAWCAYMGINRKAAERLLNVSALFDGSSPKQQKVLEELSPSLLYAAAQPSAPAELVEQVKSGDITTHKQYQELLDELKARDAALQEKDAALQQAQEAAEQERVRAKKTEQNIAALVEAADLAQTSAALEKNARETLESQRAKLLDEQDKHLARIAELEARPIGAAAPSEEQIARWRAEGAADARQEAQEALEKAEDKAAAAKREANRLRETLEGRTDHLNAVEAELKALKAELRQAREAAKKAGAPSLPAAAPAAPRLVLCADCIFRPICCGISLFAPDDLGEGTLAQFREEELDEDAFDRRLLGCTAGITKESR